MQRAPTAGETANRCGMPDATQLLQAIEQGDPRAAEQLLPLVYEELRKLAAQKLAQEKPGQTLEATALVHEAYLRLVAPASPGAPGSARPDPQWDSRGHFFAAAAEAMRRILVDAARRKLRPKHGGGLQRVDLDQACTLTPEANDDLISLDEALSKFALVAPQKAQLAKLRFFAGLTMPEAAQALGISLATAERHWTYARTWLYCELNQDADKNSEQSAGP